LPQPTKAAAAMALTLIIWISLRLLIIDMGNLIKLVEQEKTTQEIRQKTGRTAV
jgi:hypothetical protein